MLLLTTVTLLLVVVSMTYVAEGVPQDGNYNHPMFFYPEYRIYIPRGLEVGKKVFQVNHTSCVRENSRILGSTFRYFHKYFEKIFIFFKKN